MKPSEKADRAYLLHIRDAIRRIEEYSSVGRAEFFAKPHWQDAIIRQLEIVGEASKRLSEELRSANPAVPWRRVCGLRDVLIHNYMGVDLEAVWSVVEEGIPALKETLARLLAGSSLRPPCLHDKRKKAQPEWAAPCSRGSWSGRLSSRVR